MTVPGPAAGEAVDTTDGTTDGTATGTVRRRPDESMTLLREVTDRPLDPGYALMAQRRAEAGETASRRGPTSVVGLLLVAILLGAATAVAVVDLRAPQPVVAEGRTVLMEQIQERSAEVEALSERSARLSAEVDSLQRDGLLPSALLEINELDRWVNGATPVRGPGMVVKLTDGSGGGLVEPGDAPADSRVRDADVQFVVNQLWAAGAEAVAVNDQRLTSLSAIRNAGDAILVDLQPLNGPTYTIEAVGDPEDMQVEFARSAGLGFLQLLSAEYGIESEVAASEGMYLPGAGSPTLRYAHSARSGGADVPADAPAETTEDRSEEDNG